ncbi:hypothetical protein BDW60DRAFT_176087 [Aspergillus nidulans var. acristatus]
MRRLPPTIFSAALPARSIPSCSPITLANKLQEQPHIRAPTNNRQQPLPLYRSFSQSCLLANSHTTSNSPFRLSSSSSTTQSQSPETPFPEAGTETDTYIDPNTGIPVKDYSRYPPKRQWPPDMSKLSPKHQFRLERKYRRRAALKYARPKWTKATKIVQWGTIGFVIIYALLFMEWDERGGTPLEDLRTYVFGALKGAFSAPPPSSSMRRSVDSTPKRE